MQLVLRADMDIPHNSTLVLRVLKATSISALPTPSRCVPHLSDPVLFYVMMHVTALMVLFYTVLLKCCS